jgi:hypothetical protein
MENVLPNGLTCVSARGTNDVAVTPRATLHNGLTAPVPGRPRFPDARRILGGVCVRSEGASSF